MFTDRRTKLPESRNFHNEKWTYKRQQMNENLSLGIVKRNNYESHSKIFMEGEKLDFKENFSRNIFKGSQVCPTFALF